MRLSDYLKEKFINLELASTTRDDAIRELAEPFRSSPCVTDFDAYLAGVFEREKQASTGIGRGAAIPHARTNAVSEIVVAVGRASVGIDFETVDGDPVRIIVLMGTPETKASKYLRLLAHLSHLFKTNGFLPAVLKAASPAEVIGLFQSRER